MTDFITPTSHVSPVPYVFPKFWLVLKLRVFSDGLHLYHSISTLSSFTFSCGYCSLPPVISPVVAPAYKLVFHPVWVATNVGR